MKILLILLLLTGCATKDPVSALVYTTRKSLESTQNEVKRLEDTLPPECKTDGVLAIIRVLNDRVMLHSEQVQDIETVYKARLETKDETIAKLWAFIVISLIALGFSLKKLFT